MELIIFVFMEDNLVDFSVLEQLSGGDPKYKYELLGIFLDSVDTGMANLEQLVKNTNDFDAIFKQAHALKSPAGIINIKDMHARMAKIEELGRAGAGKDEINTLLDDVLDTYKKVHPVLVEERAKYAHAAE